MDPVGTVRVQEFGDGCLVVELKLEEDVWEAHYLDSATGHYAGTQSLSDNVATGVLDRPEEPKRLVVFTPKPVVTAAQ